MDSFTYNNIFDTKGIEYLIIIAFLLLIIPFWLFINKKASIGQKIHNAMGVLSAAILRVPKGLFYTGNHTWTYLEKSGNAKVGLDDLLLHLTGEVKFIPAKNNGDYVKKGDLVGEIAQNGKFLKIFSPVTGKIEGPNTILSSSPELLNEDPYGKGWLYRINPSDWIAETSSYYLAEDAVNWIGRELDRFKDFLALSLQKHSQESSMVILQDGGELCDKPLSELPDEIWKDFQKSFLN